MSKISSLTSLPGLDFLCRKARILHGDLSPSNIMINRLSSEESDKPPSELREIACSSVVLDPRLDDGNSGPLYLPDPSTVTKATGSDNLSAETPVDCFGTTEEIESSGMIIDGDFMRNVDDTTRRASVSSFVSRVK